MVKEKKKIISLIMVIVFIFLVTIPVMVNANSDIPKFDIKIVAQPESAEIGKDIVVKGTITPHDIVAQVKPKEVVLVLDTSGSMQECANERMKEYTGYYKYDNPENNYRTERRYIEKTNKYCKKHQRVGSHYTNNHDSLEKIDELKKSALAFIDKMKDVPNLNMGIVTFESKSEIKKDLCNDFDDLKLVISGKDRGDGVIRNDLKAGGGTNIGDGLRQGAYLLSNSSNQTSNAEKYMVFMTDGEPTQFGGKNLYNNSYINDYYRKGYTPPYFLDITCSKSNENKTIDGYMEHNIEYAKKVGEIIKNENYNVYSIGYDLENITSIDATKTLKDIHNSMTSKEENFFESSTGSLEKIFADIADKIAYSATDVKLNLDLPKSIEIIGQGKDISLNNIVYKEAYRENNKITYHAEPIDFEFKIKGKKVGKFDILKNAKITFMWNGKQQEISLNSLNVTITDKSEPKVTLEVRDSAKTIKYDSTTNKDYVGENYKLYGKSDMEINVSGVDAKYLRYKLNEKDNWSYVELKFDNDIKKEEEKPKEGYLTNMPYDVSHMPLRSNEEMWNNRNNVFKDPFLKKITDISTKLNYGNNYVKKEQCKKENGQEVTRWKPETLFVENHDVSSYAPDYKEARKTWGYMTVPEDGEYTFKAETDDGFYGNITVDGETKVIGNAFRVKWHKDQPPSSEPIKLEKGKYYPVYFEYFNWGGGACYKILCSTNGDIESSYKEVNSMGAKFYPSKSNLPILDANNGFKGSKFIYMPSKVGKYTFQYELVDGANDEECKGQENKGHGTFGTFEIEERFDLSKYFSKGDNDENNELTIEKDDKFKINYKLKAKDISLKDLYGENIPNSPVQEFSVESIAAEDTLPEGLFTKIKVNEDGVEKEIESDKINLSEKSLKYKLNGDKYSAEDCILNVYVECRDNVSGNIHFKKSGKVSYSDASLNGNRISIDQDFNDELDLKIVGCSEITRHGIFIDNEIKDPNKDNEYFKSKVFAKDTAYTLGFIIDAKGSDNNFTLNTNDADISNVSIYELDANGKINFDTKVKVYDISNIGTEGNNIGSKLEKGKKYAVIYYAKFKTNNDNLAEFKAKLDTGSTKVLRLNFTEELPDLF